MENSMPESQASPWALLPVMESSLNTPAAPSLGESGWVRMLSMCTDSRCESSVRRCRL